MNYVVVEKPPLAQLRQLFRATSRQIPVIPYLPRVSHVTSELCTCLNKENFVHWTAMTSTRKNNQRRHTCKHTCHS